LGLAVDTRIPPGKAERARYNWLINSVERFVYQKDEGDHWHIRLTDPCP
jgi:hypothetical protein